MSDARVVVITGGGTHLGRATAERLAGPGIDVVIASRDIQRSSVVAGEISRHGGPCHAMQCDVADPDSVRALFARVAEDYGRLDVLVCNAGGSVTKSGFLGAADEDVDATIRTNLMGSYYCSREAAALMLPHRAGAIVLVASIHGTVGSDPSLYDGIEGFEPSGPAYHAAKGGIIQLTRSLATTFGRAGIRVNCVSPGMVPNADTPQALIEREIARTPLGRLGKPEDIAGAIAFLSGPEASWITGQNLVIDGGWTSW